MLTKRIIASLLLKNGRLVKGKQCQNHRDAGSPVTTVRSLCNQGVDEIILLDISETAPNLDLLEALADGSTVPLTFGGGIRDREAAREAFQRGADKVYLGGSNLALARSLSDLWGTQAIVLGSNGEIPDWPGELRLLDVAREGTRQGFGLQIPRRRAPTIIEGGVGNLNHITEAFKAGADAVALGTMLTFGDNNILKIKRHLKARGFPMRFT